LAALSAHALDEAIVPSVIVPLMRKHWGHVHSANRDESAAHNPSRAPDIKALRDGGAMVEQKHIGVIQ
jgi:hypothetical protein